MVRKILVSLFPIIALVLLSSEQMSDNGRAGRTGSPGETTCTNCHDSYALNSGGGSISLQCATMPTWQYTPGTTYSMSVTVTRSTNSLFGVGVEILDATNHNAGNIIVTDAGSTQTKNATVSGVSRKNLVHQLNGGASSGYKVFNFNWTAPATNIGNVTFYFAGVAANSDGNELYDYVYAANQVMQPATSVGIDQILSASFISVYPNPVTNNLNISYLAEASGMIEINLFNHEGKLIRTIHNMNTTYGLNTESFDELQNCAPGIYFLQTVVNNKSFSEKVIIQ